MRLNVGPAGEVRTGWVRSYLGDGRLVQGQPPDERRWAIDAELASQPIPRALARHVGAGTGRDEFWRRWTAMETVCKLLDVPAHIWLKAYGLDAAPAGISVTTTRWRGIVVSAAAATPAA
jgi:hypothetical protein